MKFIYITHKSFPARTADDFYTKALAKAFSRILGDKFLLVLADDQSNDMDDVSSLSLGLKLNINRNRIKFYLYYLYWMPKYIFSQNDTESLVFFVGDPNLALILILTKKIFRFKYQIYTDWHMLYKTWKYSYMAKNSDFLISTSERLKKNIVEEFKILPEKIKVVYGGVDLVKFQEIKSSKEEIRRALQLPTDKILVSYVGFFKTMGMEKGISTMIKALPTIEDHRIKMVFVGGKEEQIQEYRELAVKLGVMDRIIFIGVISNDKVALYEKAMDILVIPYPDQHHFREYGFPMKVYEYMASGNPIIYSKLDIIHEMLQDCGYDFKPDNPEDLSNIINSIIKNPEDLSKKTKTAVDKTHSYTWENKVKKIVNFV